MQGAKIILLLIEKQYVENLLIFINNIENAMYYTVFNASLTNEN